MEITEFMEINQTEYKKKAASNFVIMSKAFFVLVSVRQGPFFSEVET